MNPAYELALSVKAGQRELDHRVSDLMRPLGLTAQQADAIYVIGRAGPLSLKELGDLLIAEAGHPSRLVDRLVDAGYVQRVPADDDRRRVVLTLTAAGRKLEKKVQANRESLFAVAESLMKDVDLDAALHLFRELLQHSEYDALIDRRRRLEEA